MPNEGDIGYTSDDLNNIDVVLNGLRRLDEHLRNRAAGYFVVGQLEVQHGDGLRIGYVTSREDWWEFIPDKGALDAE